MRPILWAKEAHVITLRCWGVRARIRFRWLYNSSFMNYIIFQNPRFPQLPATYIGISYDVTPDKFQLNSLSQSQSFHSFVLIKTKTSLHVKALEPLTYILNILSTIFISTVPLQSHLKERHYQRLRWPSRWGTGNLPRTSNKTTYIHPHQILASISSSKRRLYDKWGKRSQMPNPSRMGMLSSLW